MDKGTDGERERESERVRVRGEGGYIARLSYRNPQRIYFCFVCNKIAESKAR